MILYIIFSSTSIITIRTLKHFWRIPAFKLPMLPQSSTTCISFTAVWTDMLTRSPFISRIHKVLAAKTSMIFKVIVIIKITPTLRTLIFLSKSVAELRASQVVQIGCGPGFWKISQNFIRKFRKIQLILAVPKMHTKNDIVYVTNKIWC